MSKSALKWGVFTLLVCIIFYALRDNNFSKLAEMAKQQNPEALIVYFYGLLDYVIFPIAKLYASYVISSTLANVLYADSVPSELTLKETGIINYIDFSGIRVNGTPMAEAQVTYAGIEKVFSPLPKSFRIDFDKGDEVIVAHKPGDVNESVIDIQASIAAKKSIVQ